MKNKKETREQQFQRYMGYTKDNLAIMLIDAYWCLDEIRKAGSKTRQQVKKKGQ